MNAETTTKRSWWNPPAGWTLGRHFPVRALALVAAASVLSGCGRNSGPPTLDSRLFQRVEIIGTRGTGAGQLNKPRSVAVDRADHVYVVDMTGRVQKFSPQGEYRLSWQMTQTELGKPKGMCRDQAGNIVVLEPHYQRVNHFSPEGKLVEHWGRKGTGGGEFSLPRAVTVNRRGEVFVSEYTSAERVQAFSPADRKLFLTFGKQGSGEGEFNRAEGLGIGPDDRIYVADSCNHRVQIFSPQGQWLKSYGRPGRGPGEFSYPYDIAIDAEGRQYVCEFGNSRLQVFDAQNQVIEVVGGIGSAPGQFNNPWSLALDSQGNLYVADAGNHRVQKLVRHHANVSAGRASPGRSS